MPPSVGRGRAAPTGELPNANTALIALRVHSNDEERVLQRWAHDYATLEAQSKRRYERTTRIMGDTCAAAWRELIAESVLNWS
jgi:hypothetical protein